MAPVSGPLTQGGACTQPSASATLMSLNCAVAARNLSTSEAWAANAGWAPVARRDIPSGSQAIVERRKMFMVYPLLIRNGAVAAIKVLAALHRDHHQN